MLTSLVFASALVFGQIQSFTMVDPQDLHKGYSCAPAVNLVIAQHPDGQKFAYALGTGLSTSGESCPNPDQIKYAEGIFQIKLTKTHGGCFTFVQITGVALKPVPYTALTLSYSYGDPGTRCLGASSEQASLKLANGKLLPLTAPRLGDFGGGTPSP